MSETTIRIGAQALRSVGSKGSSFSQPNYKESFNARVDFVLYDDHDKERFDKYGGYEAIGTIECRMIVNNTLSAGPPVVARPMNSNNRRFPVQNEIVTIIPASSYNAQSAKTNYSVAYYYGDIVGAWDSPEHNAVPDESFFPGTDKNSYQNAQNGVPDVPGNEKSVTGERFRESGRVRKLLHGPGDVTYEGRFGQSIRFGSSNGSNKNAPWKGKDNSPVVIIRNGQREIEDDNWNPSYEDLNKESMIAMFSGQSVDFIPASSNFDSYDQKVQVNTKSQYVTAAVSETVNPTADSTLPDVVDTPVKKLTAAPVQPDMVQEEIDFLPDNENEFFQELEDCPLTNGIIDTMNPDTGKFNGGVNSTTLDVKLTKLNKRAGNLIESYAGQISNIPAIPKNGKALLDLIALTEGTIGQGNFNGYDIIVGYALIPGFTSFDYNLNHPNIAQNINGIRSTAAGRYQFLYGTWIEVGGTSFSKMNQDYNAWRRITGPVRNISIIDINNLQGYGTFVKVIDKLSLEWASFPNISKGVKGFYGQAGRYSFEILFSYYQTILQKYK